MHENKSYMKIISCHTIPSRNYDSAIQKGYGNNMGRILGNVSTPKTGVNSYAWGISIASAAFYGICSISMVFINKAVLSLYKFNFPFFIMTCQMIFTILFLEILRFSGFIKLSSYSFVKGRSCFWPALFFAIHSTTALTALSGMTVPMYGAIKRCTPFATFILSIVIFREKVPSIYICISVYVITIGCIVAGIGDLSFDVMAYTYGLISVLAQSLYFIQVQRSAENNISTLEILQSSSFNTVLFFFIISLTTQEFNHIVHFHDAIDFGFLSCFIAELVIGSIFNYSLFLCTVHNSALTTSLVGVMKSVVQTSIGFVAFGGVKFHPLNVVGLILNICGGFIYTHAKYKEVQDNRTQQTEQKDIVPKSCTINAVECNISLDKG